MRIIVFLLFIFSVLQLPAQDISSSLEKAITALQNDGQFTHSTVGFCVVETATGKVVYEKNAQTGLAPASCQKVITSASAFELLGKEYRYKTTVLLRETSDPPALMVEGSGDPTLGSWRFAATKNDRFFANIFTQLNNKNIKTLGVTVKDNWANRGNIPRGWIWEDIGNYYGAGASAINWHENQYDLILQAGSGVGKPVAIIDQRPDPGYEFKSLLTTGAKGSGDNAYIFPELNGATATVTGTIPVGENKFVISGAVTSPPDFFARQFNDFLQKKQFTTAVETLILKDETATDKTNYKLLLTNLSPALDSINYWFLKKSINLYGEALVKTIALEKTGTPGTEEGITVIKKLWAEKGIDSASIKILDGSGLSPSNRITTAALVKVLQHAKGSSWYNSFYNALPEMNGIKMKDGYIGGVRSYAGYVKSRAGAAYTFAFIVNNFDGSPSTAREKIWRLLDILK